MNRQVCMTIAALLALGTSISAAVWAQSYDDWETIFDGNNLDNFLVTGEAN